MLLEKTNKVSDGVLSNVYHVKVSEAWNNMYSMWLVYIQKINIYLHLPVYIQKFWVEKEK